MHSSIGMPMHGVVPRPLEASLESPEEPNAGVAAMTAANSEIGTANLCCNHPERVGPGVTTSTARRGSHRRDPAVRTFPASRALPPLATSAPSCRRPELLLTSEHRWPTG